MFTATTSYESKALQNNYFNHLQQQQQNQHYGKNNSPSNSSILDIRRQSNGGNISPAQFSLRSGTSFVLNSQISGDSASLIMASNADEQQRSSTINLQIFVSELQIQKCLTLALDELVWDIKKKLFNLLPQKLQQFFNYGLFLPPCDGRAGKFLLEDRPIRDYPFHDCVPYVELKYKKRVYKTMQLDEKAVKKIHSKSNLKKFMEHVINKNAEKIDNMCRQGFDPNFHDSYGDSPLTKAAGVPNNRNVLVQLIGGGAHLDFRNSDGQTALHKASFESITDNVKTLLELGASPNYRDLIGLTPLYYNMLRTESNPQVAELLLSEAADIFVVDMYANDLLHQACKNGLEKHVENLLFYGAEINAQNINGNTPLHVCAVNNRIECAHTLLYRGADPTVLNKSGQSAIHVAHIVNNIAIADVIQRHSPENIVPFCGNPKFNTRRRLESSQLSRRRSLSYSSMSNTEPPQISRQQSVLINASPAPILNNKDYDTLKKYSPEIIQFQQASIVERNIPRILVIPRGPKGFGFILRGANHIDAHELSFQPSSTVPALQFFEGVETTGMAMRAGLRPGDFLLEINGFDVRCASHEQVVDLINQSDDTISLKVITIDTSVIVRPQPINNIYASDNHLSSSAENYYYSSMMGTKRNHSVPRHSIASLPPMPPQRNPTTSLSFGRATLSSVTDNHYVSDTTFNNNNNNSLQLSENFKQQQSFFSNSTSQTSNYLYNHNLNVSFNNPTRCSTPINHINKLNENYLCCINNNTNFNENNRSSMQSISPLNSISNDSYFSNGSNGIDHYSQSNNNISHHLRCASVKSRPSPARRISAAELENLMIRQSTSNLSTINTKDNNTTFSKIQIDSILSPNNKDILKSNNVPKKFTSIAEMKRHKEMQNNTPNTSEYSLQRANSNLVNMNENNGNNKQSAFEYVGHYINDNNLLYDVAEQQKYPLKSFNSSPDLAQHFKNNNNITALTNTVPNFKKEINETESEYSQISTNRSLRPKTPPPPPPQNNILTNAKLKCQKNESNNSIYASTSAFQQQTHLTNNNNLEKKNSNDDNTNFIFKNSQKQQQQQQQQQQTESLKLNVSSTVAPPQPPPLPPPTPSPNFLKSAFVIKKQSNVAFDKSFTEKESLQNLKTQDCRGISAEILLSVKLKPVTLNTVTKSNSSSQKLNLTNLQKQQFSPNTVKSPANFNLDLQNALAKRRDKVCTDSENINDTDIFKKKEINFLKNEKSVQKNLNGIDLSTKESENLATNIIGRYGGLSLRESVCENVQGSKNTNKIYQNHHSPPSIGSLGFVTKKDSGYTSSRTSLEPSECGDESPQNHYQHNQHALNSENIEGSVQLSINPNKNNDEKLKLHQKKEQIDKLSEQLLMMSSPSTSRVTLISQQLEDTFYDGTTNTKHDNNSNGINHNDHNLAYENSSNFIELNKCTVQKQESNDITNIISNPVHDSGIIPTSNFSVDKAQFPSFNSPPIESNNTKNGIPNNNQNLNAFRLKQLFQWSKNDVYHWLNFLNLNQYAQSFHDVTGNDLMHFDRAQFTQLGVTRVAHRQAMEQSLKKFK